MKHFPSIFVGTLALALSASGQAGSGPLVTVVMDKLDDPRGLAFGPGGALFVAEAGYGGAPCAATGGTLNCYGLTGAVSRLWHGRQDRVVTKLPSVSFRLGASARGPHDIAMRFGKGAGSTVLGVGGAHVTIGLENDPASREVQNRPDLGKLVHIPNGPDGGAPESDPYGLLVERRGGPGDDEDQEDGGDVVVDASGNSLLRVDEDGNISLLGVFPSRTTTPPRPTPGITALTDSVPTSVAVGPDGAYYVGELAGIPFVGKTRDKSNVYRIEAGQDPYHPTVFLDGHATGFNAIIDMAFHGDDLYIVQHWTMAPDGTRKDGNLIRVACRRSRARRANTRRSARSSASTSATTAHTTLRSDEGGNHEEARRRAALDCAVGCPRPPRPGGRPDTGDEDRLRTMSGGRHLERLLLHRPGRRRFRHAHRQRFRPQVVPGWIEDRIHGFDRSQRPILVGQHPGSSRVEPRRRQHHQSH